MESWRSHPWVFLAFGLPGALWLSVFFLLPLGLIWVLGFGVRTGPVEIEITWTLSNYIKALDPLYLGLFAKSLLIAIASTVITLVIAFPVALAISFAQPRLRNTLLILVILPFWTNVLIRTYAMIAVLRTKGYVNYSIEELWSFLKFLLTPIGFGTLLGEQYQPVEILYNNYAVVFGIVYVYLPFMILPLYASLEKLDREFLEASLDLGATQWQTFWRVIIPLSFPGIVTGVILVFIPALGTFVISDLLGGPDSQLIGNVIERQFKSANNWPLGSAMSFILLYITFAALMLRAFYGRKNDIS